ncbi:MAG: hypothetical protein GC168_04250 [Candidatus Hydrogenedens sp.]|nr:hypothetical protein [Candidatus Hydrogenedens sp.]
MDDVRAKLDALLKSRNLMTGRQYEEQHREESEQRQSGAFDLPQVVPGEDVGEDPAFYLVRTEYPLDHLHGQLPLGSALTASGEHIAFSAQDEELIDFDPARTAFVDTETIGLAGGAGTVAFLVGVGYFTEHAFRLDQCFMRDYDEEEPMLAFLAERFEGMETVVGYNSKSFDLPLLRTRFIQNRIPFRAEACAHYDLVHAARRFYKRRLADCSLGNIEREVLGIRREGDVPSYLIPQLWFDYLRTRDARPLKGVFYHHQTDILSLVTLTAWLSECLQRGGTEGFEHAEDKLSLVRIHFRQKNYEAVADLGKRFLEADGADQDTEPERSLRLECLEMLGFAYKRLSRFEDMRDSWAWLLAESPAHLSARLELSKHYEHRERDYGRALALCDEALENPNRFGAAVASGELRARRDRIANKMNRGMKGHAADLLE